MTSGISKEMLIRYVAMRKKVDAEAKTIQSLAGLLSLLAQSGDDAISIDPVALGHVHQLIEKSILDIGEQLDSFIFLTSAQMELEKEQASRSADVNPNSVTGSTTSPAPARRR